MHPLDNVIWRALTTSQTHLGATNHCAGKFFSDVSLLGALATLADATFESLALLLRPDERVGLFLEDTPRLSPPWRVITFTPLLQMLCPDGSSVGEQQGQPGFLPLGEPDVPEMLALTQLTKPGPFARRTYEMGEYWGVRENGALIAMAGERLRLPGYTEISAVCTHPDHLGHGHATALIKMLSRRIRSRGEQPFLHVRPGNVRAVTLYERLGFEKRALMQYVILEKQTVQEHGEN